MGDVIPFLCLFSSCAPSCSLTLLRRLRPVCSKMISSDLFAQFVLNINEGRNWYFFFFFFLIFFKINFLHTLYSLVLLYVSGFIADYIMFQIREHVRLRPNLFCCSREIRMNNVMMFS